MIIDEVCLLVIEELKYLKDEETTKILEHFIPEEMFGSIDNEEYKEEVIQMIEERMTEDTDIAKRIYFYLFDEKITIEEENESFYENEEFE